MITRVTNITQINNESISNDFTIGQLTADYSDSAAITSIAVSSTAIDIKDGDKFIISGVEFTVSADASATATAISVDSITPSTPLLIGDKVKVSKENLFVQYQRKTEGKIAGMPVTADTLGPITYSGGVYSITGSDSTYVKILPRDFMVNEDVSPAPALEFKDASNTGLQVGDGGQDMIATVNVPSGTSATEVYVWGSITSKVVEVYEGEVDTNGIGSTVATGRTDGLACSISVPVAATATNYLIIKVKVTATSNRIYGGKVTLTQN
ncbi:MAG: hypothetical protein CMC55_04680 [Flavobacteriaceae bacterium]|nr:hypothetical protein [Flavobacteriaceae bacterium]